MRCFLKNIFRQKCLIREMLKKKLQSSWLEIHEPENHLHPSMQRELLPNLSETFPNAQFIIATHSPFIVTSTRESRVYALFFNQSHYIDSAYLEEKDLSGTANQTLREILGVPFTSPIWVEKSLENILEKYHEKESSVDVLIELRNELVHNNLGYLLPEALSKLKEKNA